MDKIKKEFIINELIQSYNENIRPISRNIENTLPIMHPIWKDSISE